MQTLKEPLENRDGALYVDGASARELAAQYDTPLYVISENRVRNNYLRLRDALTRIYPQTRIYYAAKANSNLYFLRALGRYS